MLTPREPNPMIKLDKNKHTFGAEGFSNKISVKAHQMIVFPAVFFKRRELVFGEMWV